MAALVIANSAYIKLLWSGPSRNWLNVIGAQGNPTLPAINQAFADSLFAAIKANANVQALFPLLPTTVSLTGIAIRDISVANRAEFTSTGAALAGSGTGDPLPLNTAACVTLRTAGAGKSFRGRAYISGFNEAQNDATGRIAAAANTAASNFLAGMNAALVANSLAMAVLSRPRDAKTIPAKTIQAHTGFSTPVTAFVVRNTKWESQRRRTGRT